MVDHTFLYSAPVRKIAEIVQAGDLGQIRYINSRRLNLGLFQKDINVAWDLAPHDISIILYILGEFPVAINCQGNAHVSPGIEDVTNMSLFFPHKRFATIQSSWLEPRKIREMTIVGSQRMIVYDDLQTREKIRIYDVRVVRPPHYDTFAEFHYSYHYGDSYIPHLQQEEPLNLACRHFIDCVETGSQPMTGGREGLEMVRLLEGASAVSKDEWCAICIRQFGWDACAGPSSDGAHFVSRKGIHEQQGLQEFCFAALSEEPMTVSAFKRFSSATRNER